MIWRAFINGQHFLDFLHWFFGLFRLFLDFFLNRSWYYVDIRPRSCIGIKVHGYAVDVMLHGHHGILCHVGHDWVHWRHHRRRVRRMHVWPVKSGLPQSRRLSIEHLDTGWWLCVCVDLLKVINFCPLMMLDDWLFSTYCCCPCFLMFSSTIFGRRSRRWSFCTIAWWSRPWFSDNCR